MKLCWWLVLVLLRLTRGDTDWSSSCPSVCKCKWVSGKKGAECTSQGLTTVPDRLSSELQAIDLSGNMISSLPSEAFKSVGLVNVHKIYLRDCGIQELHKDAFKGLAILIELDLSNNRIHYLHPGTFRDNMRLRQLFMNHNPLTKLEDGIFTNMTYLQTVDMNDCHIAHIGHKTFSNVPALLHLTLAGNNLVHMKLAVVEHLTKLSSLVLHNNPWRCDCHLKAFRDWTIARNLYAQPTSCVEPPHLANRMWTDVSSADFACKPQIVYPPADKAIVEAFSEEVTLSCKVIGNPAPEVYWVVNSRIISDKPTSSYGDSRYSVRSGGGWVNLTIGRVRVQDRGDLKCVAMSPGGMDERNVTLQVHPGAANNRTGNRGSENWVLILGLVTGLLALTIVVVVLCCCLCRKRRPPPKNKKPDAPNGDVPHGEKSLLTVVNPVQKPPRRYEDKPNELAELNRNLLDDTGTSVGGDFEERSTESAPTTPNCVEAPHYPPDLLAFPRGLSTPPLLASPVHGTLPYSRSQSPFSPTRPGYVTIPRRPRVPSWSSAPTPTLLEDPLGLLRGLEPAYDNLGPRTTADGSSVLSLNKSLPEPTRPRPLPQHCSTLPTPRKAPTRVAPDGATLSRTLSAEGPLSPSRPKVPPKPPPKPKKNGPLYEDEGEDGTEV